MEAFKRKIYTYQYYEKLPEGPAYQLIDGDLIMTPAPTLYHQAIVGQMFEALSEFVKRKHLGVVFLSPIDVYLSETETYQPDVVFISSERRTILGEKKVEGAPDLIVEILSPSTGYYDLTHKKSIYESSGVKEYWLIDPQERSIEVLENVGREFRVAGVAKDKGTVASAILDGFSVKLQELFRLIGE